jgi:hypothetical protein
MYYSLYNVHVYMPGEIGIKFMGIFGICYLKIGLRRAFSVIPETNFAQSYDEDFVMYFVKTYPPVLKQHRSVYNCKQKLWFCSYCYTVYTQCQCNDKLLQMC